MNFEALIKKREILRIKWASARRNKNNHKKTLITKGSTILEIRKDPEFRRLKKEQKKLSIELKHVEKKINKLKANTDGKK